MLVVVVVEVAVPLILVVTLDEFKSSKNARINFNLSSAAQWSTHLPQKLQGGYRIPVGILADKLEKTAVLICKPGLQLQP